MDECDNKWLDKNDEEARGEGTSAQGAVSTYGTTMRTSWRSAKSKGKEPDVAQPIVISKDVFELVVTHKTEFLHHVCHHITRSRAFNTNNTQRVLSRPFSEYQDTFSNKLSPDVFATFAVSSWIPQPQQLCEGHLPL